MTLQKLMERDGVTVKVLRNEAQKPYDKRDEWYQKANGYRLSLRRRETIKKYDFDFYQGQGITETPDERPAEIVEMLLLSANTPDDFEAFCSEYGYDTDSRKAERLHRDCLKEKQDVAAFFGDKLEEYISAAND